MKHSPRHALLMKTLALLLCLIGAGSALAKAPNAPSNLKVKALGVNSFLLTWKDRSKTEVGWEIRASLGQTNKPQRFQLIPTKDITSFVVLTNELPGKTLTFQVAAYNGTPGAEKVSKPTKPVTVTAKAENKFAAPTDVAASALDDGRIKVTWKDNSTSEYGHLVEMKTSLGNWTLLGSDGPDIPNNFIVGGLDPAATYIFRVRAYKNAPDLLFTKYSKTATATTLPLQAPANLQVTSLPDGKLSFKWQDRSSSESGFEFESRLGTAPFAKLQDFAPDSSLITPSNFEFESDYQFRLRAFRIIGGTRVYTAYTNIVSTKTTAMAAPTGLVAAANGDTSIGLIWNDVSTRETGYQVSFREVGTAVDQNISLGANAKSHTITGLTPGKQYSFKVRATGFFGLTNSTFSATAIATTRNGIYGNFNPPIIANKLFLYQIQLGNAANLTSLTVTGLPPGLSFDSTKRTIKGTVTTSTQFTATITAVFNNGVTSTKSLVLKPITGNPEVAQAFTSVSVAAATTKNVPLAGKFADPDTQSAARVFTTMGNFDIILFPDSTPITTNNFLDYVDDGRYNNTFFHRSPLNFVVQGGNFGHTNSGGFFTVQTYGQIKNEPGLSNVRGTVAMARLGGQINSATSSFFVNLGDNILGSPQANLDEADEGFTVFGRVTAPGMVLMDSINALPRQNYTVNAGNGNVLLEATPVNITPPAPAVIDPAKLVKITSIGAAPILSYQVLSQNTAIATAALNGNKTEVIVTGVAPGSTNIVVTVTDLDGQTVSQNIPVTVP
jgi:cyclophilin family peptidyl-prolyl cis-trans isomerase